MNRNIWIDTEAEHELNSVHWTSNKKWYDHQLEMLQKAVAHSVHNRTGLPRNIQWNENKVQNTVNFKERFGSNSVVSEAIFLWPIV